MPRHARAAPSRRTSARARAAPTRGSSASRRGDRVPADPLRSPSQRAARRGDGGAGDRDARGHAGGAREAARRRRLERRQPPRGRRGPPAAERRPSRTAERAGARRGRRHRDRVLVGLDHLARRRAATRSARRGGRALRRGARAAPGRARGRAASRPARAHRRRHEQAVGAVARPRRDSPRCPTPRPGVPAANASVSTIPKRSPPSDGAHSTSRAASAARFAASSTRPRLHAARVGEQRRQRLLVDADHGQPRGMVLAQGLEGAQQHRQPLALDGLADERDLERLAGRARRGAGAPPRAASPRWARSGTRRRRSAARSTPRPRTPRSARAAGSCCDSLPTATPRRAGGRGPSRCGRCRRPARRRARASPAGQGRDRLVQVDDVVAARAQLAPQRRRRERRVGDVRARAVERPRQRRARAKTSQSGRRSRVAVEGRDHAWLMPCGGSSAASASMWRVTPPG